MRGSINYQVGQIWKQVDGIGISKSITREESTIKGQNGHNVSNKVHSFNSKDEFINRAKELGNYAKQHFGIKDMQSINNEVITSYINHKIEDGLKYRSISTYISQLEKIQVGLSQMDQKLQSHQNLFTRESLVEARATARLESLKSEHINRAYNNPNAFQSDLSKKSQITLQLQKNHGLRVDEATKIKNSQLMGNNTIKIQGKGGYTRDVRVSKELYNQIAHNKGHFQSYSNYTSDLKSAVEKNGENWTGTHGLRYNYAQNTLETKVSNGMSYDEAKAEVSFELGHHRTEITEHYLK